MTTAAMFAANGNAFSSSSAQNQDFRVLLHKMLKNFGLKYMDC